LRLVAAARKQGGVPHRDVGVHLVVGVLVELHDEPSLKDRALCVSAQLAELCA
jgi:hypothetical protein